MGSGAGLRSAAGPARQRDKKSMRDSTGQNRKKGHSPAPERPLRCVAAGMRASLWPP